MFLELSRGDIRQFVFECQDFHSISTAYFAGANSEIFCGGASTAVSTSARLRQKRYTSTGAISHRKINWYFIIDFLPKSRFLVEYGY
jgi:hypothetical protein